MAHTAKPTAKENRERISREQRAKQGLEEKTPQPVRTTTPDTGLASLSQMEKFEALGLGSKGQYLSASMSGNRRKIEEFDRQIIQAISGEGILEPITQGSPATGNFDRQLQRGDQGEDVKALQQFLIANGFMTQEQVNTGPGIFGPQTERAVQDYQTSQGIVTSGNAQSTGFGRFGPKTIASVNSNLSNFAGRGFEEGVDEDPFETALNSLPEWVVDLMNPIKELVDNLHEQGLQVNPDISIDQSQLDEFMDQAKRELGPFFSGEQRFAMENLTRSLGRSSQLLGQAETDLEKGFTDEFRGIGESAAERGITRSGERLRLEGELADETNKALRRNREALAFSTGSSSLEAERFLGSKALGGLNFPSIGLTPRATAEGLFERGTSTSALGGVRGDIFGTLPSSRRVAEQQRSLQLEDVFRRQRSISNTG